ncbi:Anthranilate phosphoribosyltransferase [Pseudosulfitobacter pseudonitzschiae]|uniref:Glycosyl transferase family 3 n=1 Tax=Pseudosulfitobacter pseudonitzschiae TaxID=1402135 RepID=A0A073JCW3_9RHOB|nr:glycosyl transferase family protein [Pseudosulfitobacter pseudonitzschiae]KEJ95542.1 glycosyl transferase family 3 [Pseudosulfitobacter pseudonitzschiae]QKS10131.1 glycosyl transferase family protein [Pseudosulfitobacter pseudonitzschiae]SHE84106.1 Anthranilate phosphoribosyltransferase [Pseudosulfitobacter pseudonitzschiae]
MTLAPYVAILGRGQGRARSLTMDEARAAMKIILSGEGAPEAIGAILMLLRMKGEVAEEIAGFTAAARAALPVWHGARPAVDWPSYAAGRTRGQPWFLAAARLVAQAGHPVLLHGWNSHQATGASVRVALGDVGIAQVGWDAAPAELAQSGIAYVPLEKMHPRLMDLLRLRDTFGLRSCINTVLRMLNPAIAPVALQGVFHPSYRELQRDAAALLGQPTLRVLKGGGGEFEHHPAKDMTLHGLNRGDLWEGPTGAPMTGHHRLSDTESTLSDVWNGVVQDDFATAIITSTAALALAALGVADAGCRAQTLWQSRLHPRAA